MSVPYRSRLAAILIVAALALLGLSQTVLSGADAEAFPSDWLVAHFIDVDQGDATLILGPGVSILIDAGRHDRDDVVSYLKSVGVEALDLLIGTHPHADHIGQFPQVLESFPVREAWLSGDVHTTRAFERAIDAILASGAGYREPRAGDVVDIGPVRIEVVHPDRLTGDFNNNSISLRLIFGDAVFLFTGDAENETETAMIERGHALRAHVLHVGHHGSRTSSSERFLDAVQPELAVYSAGRDNVYGHPHPEVLERLSERGIAVFGTDVHGTIRVGTDGDQYVVRFSAGDERTFLPHAALGGCGPDQVDINAAPKDRLTDIVHIGPSRADQLILLRPFASLQDLTRISGIGDARIRDIESQGLACVM